MPLPTVDSVAWDDSDIPSLVIRRYKKGSKAYFDLKDGRTLSEASIRGWSEVYPPDTLIVTNAGKLAWTGRFDSNLCMYEVNGKEIVGYLLASKVCKAEQD